VRLEHAVATAFGAMRGDRLALDPAMTVIHGPNEAGKSTWFAALYAGLAGRKRGASRAPQKEFRRRHKPWAGSAWRVELTVALDSGLRLHIDQNLADCSVRVKDASTGGYLDVAALEREVGTSLIADGGFDGSRLLGLDRDAVRSTFFVGQADMLAVLRNANELQRHLQRAASSTHVDSTAEEAIHRIKDQRSTRVGSPHIGNRPLRATTAAVAEAAAEVDSALDVRHRLLAEQATLKTNIARAEHAQARLRDLETLAEWVEIDRLLNRAKEARELERNLAEAGAAGEPADEAATRRVAGLVEAYLNRGEPPAAPAGISAADLQREIDGLPAMPDGPREAEPDVIRLEESFAAAVTALKTLRGEAVPDPAEIAVDAAPDELRAIADRLEAKAPVLRQGVEGGIENYRAELQRKRAEHSERLFEYESAAARYEQAQTAYTQQLGDYELALQRFRAEEARYDAEIEAHNVTVNQLSAARAEHIRATDNARLAAEAAKKRRKGGIVAIAFGAALLAAAGVIGILGSLSLAIGIGCVAVALGGIGGVIAARPLPDGKAPAFQERAQPTAPRRPTAPSPPQAPAPLGLVHPGDAPAQHKNRLSWSANSPAGSRR